MSGALLNLSNSAATGILHLPGTLSGGRMEQSYAQLTACTDEELVAVVLTQAEAYGEVMARYEAPLDRYIQRLGVRTIEDRQDVLQEIFIKAYRNLNSFDRALKFSSWLYRIAHNEAISWYRKKNVRPEGHLIGDSDTVLTFLTSAELQTDTVAIERLNAEALATALAALPEKYRTVLVLRYFEHKEYDEISDILQIPSGTVGTLLHRGKARLATLLETAGIAV